MKIHFSCGATSAIAGAIILREDPSAEIIYADTGAEHPDNNRFMRDCEEKLFKKKITVVKSKKWPGGLFELLKTKKVLSFAKGSPCTTELKKEPIRDYLGIRLLEEEQVFGFDTGELSRIERYKANNPELRIRVPLIDHGLSKANCLAILMKLGIDIPYMYKLGYSHSNCIGCVKARDTPRYWRAIKEDFPEIYQWMATHERRIGFTMNRKRIGGGKRVPLYLDELSTKLKSNREIEISCGYSCGAVAGLLNDARDESECKSSGELEDWFTKNFLPT